MKLFDLISISVFLLLGSMLVVSAHYALMTEHNAGECTTLLSIAGLMFVGAVARIKSE